MKLQYKEAIQLLSEQNEKQYNINVSKIISTNTESNLLVSLALYFINSKNYKLFKKIIYEKDLSLIQDSILFTIICKKGDLTFLNLFLDCYDIDLNLYNGRFLIKACFHNNYNVIKKLIDKGVNLLDRQAKAYRILIDNGNFKSIDLFLKEKRFSNNIDTCFKEISISYIKNGYNSLFFDLIKNIDKEKKEKDFNELFLYSISSLNITVFKYINNNINLDINMHNGEAIFKSIYSSEIFKSLLKEKELNIYIRNEMLIRKIVNINNYEMFLLLDNYNFDYTIFNFKLLKLSYNHLDKKIFNNLLYKKKLINHITSKWINKNIKDEKLKCILLIEIKLKRFK